MTYNSVGDQFLKREKTLLERLRYMAKCDPHQAVLLNEAADALEKFEHTLSVWVERVERLERELEELKR
jgi:hypothetical protein